MKVIIVLAIKLMIFSVFIGQDTLKWTQFKDLNDSLQKQTKPLLIKIETPWCSVCKMMDMKVFSDKKVQKELSNYYILKLDAEYKQAILYNDTTYYYSMYNLKSGAHQLATKLGKQNGKLVYPTLVIVDNFKVVKLLDGYLPKNQFVFWLKS